MTLFVTGLMDDMDDMDLKEMFELYGEVSSAKVVMDKVTRKSRCFGFVEMPDNAEAKEAINLLHGVGLGRKKMSVQEAEQRAPASNNYDRDRRGGGDRSNRRY